MEIVIENPADVAPGLSMQLPLQHHRSFRSVYNNSESTATTPDYYSTLQPRSGPLIIGGSDLDGAATTSVRRVDRSGLLEISEMEPPASTRSLRPRLLTGSETQIGIPAGGAAGGTLSRRVDRLGLLEAVPEVPDQSHRIDEERGTLERENSSSTTRSITERQLTGAESNEDEDKPKPTASPCNLKSPIEVTAGPMGRRRSMVESYGSSETVDSRHQSGESPQTVTSSPYFRYPGSSPKSTGSQRASPLSMSGCCDNESRARVRSKFLPIEPQSARNRQSCVEFADRSPASYEGSAKTSLAPDALESSGLRDPDDSREKKIENSMGRQSPRLRNEQTLTTLSSVPDVIETHGTSTRAKRDEECVPEGERAEAEGCEHTVVESLEESRVSFKAPNNKLLHNDNIQTLRVIILSEQL